MNIILLSGGSGKRLWPLSNEVRSKQFLKILRAPDGKHESMLQYIYRNLAALSETSSAPVSARSLGNQDKPVQDGKGSQYIKHWDFMPDSYKVNKLLKQKRQDEREQQEQRGEKLGKETVEITIATSANQVSSIRSQLGDAVGISIEPCRRDTFPAIALATTYLHDIRGIPASEAVVICPVDSYVEDSYFTVIKKMYSLAASVDGMHDKADEDGGNRCGIGVSEYEVGGVANIVLMGIEPAYPSTKYGYIIPTDRDVTVSYVSEFKEKPTVNVAERYIASGAMWNGGVFAFQLSYLLEKSQSLLGYSSYNALLANYASFPKISMDYAVVEKEKSVQVVRYKGAWKDLGTWNTLTEAMSEAISGNAVAPLSTNTHVINELQIPLVALGVKDLAIAATPDGILVTDKKSSDKLKDYVSDNRPMYEKRLWGEYKVLDMFASPVPVALTKSTASTTTATVSYMYAHNKAVDNIGKDIAESHQVFDATQIPVRNTTDTNSSCGVSKASKTSKAGDAEDNICLNICDNRNIKIINDATRVVSYTSAVSATTTERNTAGACRIVGADMVAGTETGSNSLTKHLIIKAGNHISYQLHRHRSEVWTFIAGRGLLLLGDKVKEVTVGDVVKIAAGVRHGIMAIPATSGKKGTDLHIIEVQIGDELTEEDIERFNWPLSPFYGSIEQNVAASGKGDAIDL